MGDPDCSDRTGAQLEREVTALTRALAEALEQQAATAEVLRIIASSPTDLQAVLEAIAEQAARVCDGTDAQIFRVDGEVLRRVVHCGPLPTRPGTEAGLPIGRHLITSRAVIDRQTIHVQDYEDYRAGGESDTGAPGTSHRTFLATPLLREGTPIGAITIRRGEVRPFTEAQIQLLETFADQAVIAIENARLFEELGELNRTLEARVTEQVEQLERVGRLRRYLSPQLADLIVSSGDESMLESHRRQITVVFCDLRGSTAFAETAEPEEVMGVLAEYHGAMGELISRFDGTIEHFAGDGLMVFFNDPLPQPDHAERAVRMAWAMRARAADLARGWRKQGHELGFGVGIAVGYATLGRVGFEERYHYTAVGTVANLAARLCDEAADGQILVSGRLHGMVEDLVEAEHLGELPLKGFHRAVATFNVVNLRADGSTEDAELV